MNRLIRDTNTKKVPQLALTIVSKAVGETGADEGEDGVKEGETREAEINGRRADSLHVVRKALIVWQILWEAIEIGETRRDHKGVHNAIDDQQHSERC